MEKGEHDMKGVWVLVLAPLLALSGCQMIASLGGGLQVLGGAVADAAKGAQASDPAGLNTPCGPDARGRPAAPDCNPPLTDAPPPLRPPAGP